jgi:hypothetical protein
MTIGTEDLAVLPDVVANVLFADLKAWLSPEIERGSAMAAIRYEAFAKRIVAAQYGREDAVAWAYDWYGDIVQEAKVQMESDFQRRRIVAQAKEETRKQFLNGVCGNPYYQAFLDTIENIGESLMSNVEYFAWHAKRLAEYEKLHPKAKRLSVADYEPTFGQFLREYAEQHLSDRVRKQRMASR